MRDTTNNFEVSQISNEFVNNFLDNSAEILDIYFLTRCFRSFIGTKYGFSNIPCKNIMAWFGAKHIENIVNILVKIGAELVIEKGSNEIIRENKKRKCLSFDEISQPWFS